MKEPKDILGLKVTRGLQEGVIHSYAPSFKGCITVKWSSGLIEGWFDLEGTDGTEDVTKNIKIHFV